MEYNTSREHLILPEYGRIIHNLIQYTKKIEDKEKRQLFAERTIELMKQMHPKNKNCDDCTPKLWGHLFMMADYEIDVDVPNGERPERIETVMENAHISYPKSPSRLRHYGRNVQLLIDKAIEMEEGPIKEGFVNNIAAYMKMAFRNWNTKHYVNDQIIRDDMSKLSGGKITLDEDAEILVTAKLSSNNYKKRGRRSYSSYKKPYNKRRKK